MEETNQNVTISGFPKTITLGLQCGIIHLANEALNQTVSISSSLQGERSTTYNLSASVADNHLTLSSNSENNYTLTYNVK